MSTEKQKLRRILDRRTELLEEVNQYLWELMRADMIGQEGANLQKRIDQEITTRRPNGTPRSKNDRQVYQNEDGEWVNKRAQAKRPSSTHQEKEDAIEAARGNLERSGGGDLIIYNSEGKARRRETVEAKGRY